MLPACVQNPELEVRRCACFYNKVLHQEMMESLFAEIAQMFGHRLRKLKREASTIIKFVIDMIGCTEKP